MPKPNPNETKDEFISRYMESEEAKKKYPDKEQRLAVANSAWEESTKKQKKSRFCIINGLESKEGDDLIKGGFIATTHLDSGFYDPFKEKLTRDRISKETLDVWAQEINSNNPRANKVSVNHNRVPHVAGKGIPGSAQVIPLPDGEYGLYVDTLIDKTRDDFEDLSYRLDKGLLDSFSIEYDTGIMSTGAYYDGAVEEQDMGSYIQRTLLPNTVLEGYTLASQPMNEHAIMIKEINLEAQEEKQRPIATTVTNEQEAVSKDTLKQKEVTNMTDEVKQDTVKEVKEVKEPKISEAELKEFNAYKEKLAKEKKEADMKAISDRIKEELKEDLSKVEVKTKVMKTKEEKEEHPQLVEFKEMLKEPKGYGVDAMFKVAAKTSDVLNLTSGGIKTDSKSAEAREYKSFRINNNKLEFKSLGITTNQNTDTDYLLSSAELADVFDPVIYNYLNQKTTTWNVLQKDDYSSKGNNQVQFTIKTARNGTAAAYTGNAISLGNVSRQKYMTKFKKYAVGVSIDGDMIAAARGGPIGDVFAQEVMDSTDDLMEVMNQALYAEVGLETAAGVIGFEYLADSAGNTTLYNVTRSAANQLAPDSAGNTYIDGNSAKVSKTNLRAAIRNAIEEGASLNNLVFFCSPIQYDMIKSLYDDAQRLVPTSARFGFEGMIEFEGVPVFFDKDCNDDDIFLIDLETHRVGIWVPPTLEMLGKDSDSEKGFVKTYWATYNRAPRRIAMIYGNATS